MCQLRPTTWPGAERESMNCSVGGKLSFLKLYLVLVSMAECQSQTQPNCCYWSQLWISPCRLELKWSYMTNPWVKFSLILHVDNVRLGEEPWRIKVKIFALKICDPSLYYLSIIILNWGSQLEYCLFCIVSKLALQIFTGKIWCLSSKAIT